MNDTLPFLPEDLYAVIGWPLSHSLSPLVHNTAFQTLGLKAVYMRFAVEPPSLAGFMASVRTLPVRGLSVTIPHKTAVIPFLDAITDEARQIGAVNTVFWDNDVLSGDNTDIRGFLAPLEKYSLAGSTVLLLGAGGAARAALAGLVQRNVREVFVTTPSNTRHTALAKEFGATPVPWQDRHNLPATLIVNATPLGMRNAHENETPVEFSHLQNIPEAVYDIVYTPRATRFLCEAEKAGVALRITGEEMFFAQANAQFARWTQRDLPREARDALEEALSTQS
ncbi:MAG: shikimate dehydrogenase [Desulfovibrio sp.]|nr:shikimate dehydrogenase [Desulfovibrio sp.]